MSGTFPIDIIGAAQSAEKKWRVFASVSLAQWALESSWGTRTMGTANNCFGIKPWKKDQPFVMIDTHEVINGESVAVKQPFCVFKSIADCFDAHGEFLARNKRYAKAFTASDGIDQAEAIAAAGYATDPKYADKLVSIIEQHRLMRYDTTPTIPIPREPPPAPAKKPVAKTGAAAAGAVVVAAGTTAAASGGNGWAVGILILAALALAVFLVLHFRKKV